MFFHPDLFSLFGLSEVLALSARNYAVNATMRRSENAKLVWSDEFDGFALDPAKWSYDTSRNKQGWYNGEQQYYARNRPQNLRLENGHLVIEARRDPEELRSLPDWGGQSYSSAKIVSKASWSYGFYEVRAKLPCALGTWPAIWLLPQAGGPWPDSGEIDLVEQVGSQPNVAHATVHTALFNHKLKTQRGAEIAIPTACTAFHRYQLDWAPGAITIGVDDQAYMRVRNDQPGGRGAWPFDGPLSLILNLALGGTWAGAPDNDALPSKIEVDYARVWSGDGGAIQTHRARARVQGP